LGHNRLPVLVLSMHAAPIHAERAFKAGAGGYVTKQEMSETVLIAIRRVLSGRKHVSPKIRVGRM
jgi:DNA-binding NarL/FixJ family response regulator